MIDKEYDVNNINEEYIKSISKPPENGKLKGKIMRFIVADSYSYYIITKENKKYVYLKKLKIKDYDNYTNPAIGENGMMTVKQAFADISASYKMYKLFSIKD